MRLRVLYHGNCFDGCSSAGVFTRFYRERIAKDPLEVVYRPLEHKGDAQPFAADFFDAETPAFFDAETLAFFAPPCLPDLSLPFEPAFLAATFLPVFLAIVSPSRLTSELHTRRVRRDACRIFRGK